MFVISTKSLPGSSTGEPSTDQSRIHFPATNTNKLLKWQYMLFIGPYINPFKLAFVHIKLCTK